jgi:hypothetical protein
LKCDFYSIKSLLLSFSQSGTALEKGVNCVGDAMLNNASDLRLLMEVFGEADGLVMYRFLEQS